MPESFYIYTKNSFFVVHLYVSGTYESFLNVNKNIYPRPVFPVSKL